MQEIVGNIWDYHDSNNWVVVSTNWSVNRNGLAVMGRGVAYQAAEKFPNLRREYADSIAKFRSFKVVTPCLSLFPHYNLIMYPVKYEWNQAADMSLIEGQAKRLVDMAAYLYQCYAVDKIYLPRVGCRNGRRSWAEVKPVLEKYLVSPEFVVVSLPEEAN